MNETRRAITSIIRGYVIFLVMLSVSVVTFVVVLTISLRHTLPYPKIGLGVVLLCIAAYISAIIKYYRAFKRLGRTLDQTARSATSKLRLAAICSMLTLPLYVLGLFVFVDVVILFILPTIVIISNITLNTLGYNELRESESLDQLGKKGALYLYYSSIIYAISVVCVLIAPYGIAISTMGCITHWVLFFVGWSKIRTSFRVTVPPQNLAQ